MVYPPFLPQECIGALLLVVTDRVILHMAKIVTTFVRLTDLRGHLTEC